jgi:hypothetical protein
VHIAKNFYVNGQQKNKCKTICCGKYSAIAWYIESMSLLVTAEKFADDAYDYFIKLADKRKSYPICREPRRAALGYNCIPYKKKYIVVFIESDSDLTICEFISAKLIYW